MYWQHESDNQYMTQLNTILLGPKSVHTMVYAAKRCHHSRHDAIDIDISYKLLTKYGYLIIHSVQFLYEIWSLYFIVALCDIFLGFNLIERTPKSRCTTQLAQLYHPLGHDSITQLDTKTNIPYETSWHLKAFLISNPLWEESNGNGWKWSINAQPWSFVVNLNNS